MSLNPFRRSTSFRIALGFCVVFLVCTMAVYIVVYNLFSHALKRHDRDIIVARATQLSAEYRDDGMKTFSVDRLKGTDSLPFFTRVADANGNVLFEFVPGPLQRFQISALPGHALANTWSMAPVSGDEDVLEVWNQSLGEGKVLEIGRSDEERNDMMELLQRVFAIGAGCATLLGAAVSIWYTRRIMVPIKSLTQALQTVSAGNFSARVPAVPKATDEIASVVHVFNIMADKIQALVKGMREGLDSVAHDLRTPLTRMRAKAEIALQGHEENMPEALSECLEASDELLTLVSTVLDLSEAESGATLLNRTAFHLSDVVTEVLELYEIVAEDRKIEVASEMDVGLEIFGDRAKIKRIVANLIDNALKYSGEGSSVRVTAKRVERGIRLSVRDSGAGLEADELSRIWERFYRTEKSRTLPGFGLGLSVAKVFAELHDGTLEAVSVPGQGSTFSLFVPDSF